MLSTKLLLILATTFLSLEAFASDLTLVGVLEDRAPAVAGEKNRFRIRAMFFKSSTGWRSFPSESLDAKPFPDKEKWTIAFDGKRVGEVTTRRPDTFAFFADVGDQLIADQKSVPTVGKRPLVAISKPNFSDPDGWKPLPPPADVVEKARKEFKKNHIALLACKSIQGANTQKCKYSIQNLEIGKSYGSKHGSWVVSTRLKIKNEDGENFIEGEEGPAYASGVVFVSKERVISLPSSLALLDAGDYDGDGRSEVIFTSGGYDLGGYALYYNDFKESAKFEFHYH